MKRIAEWFAAVGAAAGRKGKRLVAIVAAVAMLGGVAGVSATAMADDGNASTTQSQTTDEKAAASAPAPLSTEGTNGVPDDPTLSAPAREKTVTANEDGTYTVALNVTGAKSAGTGEIVTNQPLDIVLVLDVSGSMAEKIASGWNQPTKIDSLKTAVNKFINATAAENAKITDQSQRNRIALVKFAGTEKTSVGNDFGSVKPTLTYERGALIREEVQTFSLWPLLLNGYRYSKARGVHVQHQCSGCGS